MTLMRVASLLAFVLGLGVIGSGAYLAWNNISTQRTLEDAESEARRQATELGQRLARIQGVLSDAVVIRRAREVLEGRAEPDELRDAVRGRGVTSILELMVVPEPLEAAEIGARPGSGFAVIEMLIRARRENRALIQIHFAGTGEEYLAFAERLPDGRQPDAVLFLSVPASIVANHLQPSPVLDYIALLQNSGRQPVILRSHGSGGLAGATRVPVAGSLFEIAWRQSAITAPVGNREVGLVAAAGVLMLFLALVLRRRDRKRPRPVAIPKAPVKQQRREPKLRPGATPAPETGPAAEGPGQAESESPAVPAEVVPSAESAHDLSRSGEFEDEPAGEEDAEMGELLSGLMHDEQEPAASSGAELETAADPDLGEDSESEQAAPFEEPRPDSQAPPGAELEPAAEPGPGMVPESEESAPPGEPRSDPQATFGTVPEQAAEPDLGMGPEPKQASPHEEESADTDIGEETEAELPTAPAEPPTTTGLSDDLSRSGELEDEPAREEDADIGEPPSGLTYAEQEPEAPPVAKSEAAAEPEIGKVPESEESAPPEEPRPEPQEPPGAELEAAAEPDLRKLVQSSGAAAPLEAQPDAGAAEMAEPDEATGPAGSAGADEPLEKPEASIFRAYDIRGVVGQTLSPPIAEWIGRAIGSEARARGLGRIAVARDGRLSGSEMLAAVARGLVKSGLEVIEVGAVPTPVLYFAARELGGGSGVMVTGSHNPPDYNGFKIVLGGETLSGAAIRALYRRIEHDDLISATGSLYQQSVTEQYLERIGTDIQLERPLKVVADCGNGIAGLVVQKLLASIGADVIPLYAEVDGTFPNHHPDPGDPATLEDLKLCVRGFQADLGVAFDGDGDRLGVVAPNGEIIWPDRLMVLFARDVLSRNPGAPIIFDVKCSGRLAREIEAAGGRPVMARTGHSFIKKRLVDEGSPLAGEMSGHFFFAERWYGFDDGLYAAARLLEILAADTRDTGQVFGALPRAESTPELKLPMAEGEPHPFVEAFQEQARFENAEISTIDGLRADFTDGWGLVRASNTTPVVVLRFEGDDADALHRVQARFREQMLAINPDLELPF